MPKLSKGKAIVLKKDELNRLLKISSIGVHGKRNYLLIIMSFGTGMRAMELASLKLNQIITPDNKVIEEVSLSITKGKKQRNIYLSDERIKSAILEYVKERKNSKKVFSIHQPVFLSQKGTRFSAKSLQKLFEHLYRNAGIIGASSHSGRRTFATNLIEKGVDIKAVSTLMGHATITMTAEYVQDNPERLKKISALAID